jgi:hypothetical protein
MIINTSFDWKRAGHGHMENHLPGRNKKPPVRQRRRVTRRGLFAAGLAAAGVAVLLAIGACGGGDSSGGSPTPAVSGASPSAGASSLGPTPTRPEDCGPTENKFGIISKLLFSGGNGGLFKKGDEVQMKLVLTNCGDNNTQLDFTTSQRYVFIVQRADTMEEVWRSSDGKSYEQVLGEETIHPAETVEYAETWDQKSAKGQQVDPGTYKVSGFSVGCATKEQTGCHFGIVLNIQINE